MLIARSVPGGRADAGGGGAGKPSGARPARRTARAHRRPVAVKSALLWTSSMPVAVIESLDHEGRGVTHVEGKAVFVEGGLPGETVEYSVYRRRPSYELAQVSRIIGASAQRVAPKCAYFGKCGGCSMQHLDPVAQAAVKQRVLEDALWHIGKLRPEIIYPAIHGPAWGYRHRARIGVRLVPKKGGVLVGFHERRSSYIADMLSCEILPAHLSAMLPALRELVAGLSIPDRLPQIEIAVGDDVTVLVFRNLLALTAADEARLARFAEDRGVQVWLQPAGPDSAYRLHPQEAPGLAYALPEFDVTMDFRPTDFTQVNVAVNRLLIRRSMQLLAPRTGERIADLFCGLGNFSLPIARRGATVIGVEGSDNLVQRAGENARRNGLQARCEFHAANLFEATEDSLAALGALDKMLIDPPREGAIAVVKAISAQQAPTRIVYVSCNPATLARDAAVLVHEKGYTLRGAGIANMFPQTSHVESIALFERLT
jgi:23S rRNA (uracil1939-C5)-methyltransferase